MRRTLLFGAAAWSVLLVVNRSLVEVAGPSMAPTLTPGQRLVTVPVPPGRLDAGRRVARRLVAPGRIVVVADPTDPGHLVVKRVRDVRPDGSVWVEGDDASRSTDSRAWGWLDAGAVRRVVVGRWPWPGREPARPR